MTDRLLSLAEAAQRCRVSQRTLRRHFADDPAAVRIWKIGRRRLVSATELEVWLSQRAERAQATLPSDLLARFSPDARALIKWAICARKCAQTPNIVNRNG